MYAYEFSAGMSNGMISAKWTLFSLARRAYQFGMIPASFPPRRNPRMTSQDLREIREDMEAIRQLLARFKESLKEQETILEETAKVRERTFEFKMKLKSGSGRRAAELA